MIEGCILSGLLSVRVGVPTTIGLVDAEAAAAHYRASRDLGFAARPLACSGRDLAADAIVAFRDRFGSAAPAPGR